MLEAKVFAFVLQKDGKTLVSIDADGEVEYGEDYCPDVAATIFWNAIAHQRNAAKKAILDTPAAEVAQMLPKDAEGCSLCRMIANWLVQEAQTLKVSPVAADGSIPNGTILKLSGE